MEKREKIISKAFGSITMNARSQLSCAVMPASTPYFEPKRCRVICIDPRDPNSHKDLKIGAVTVGGSPQIAINELSPDRKSAGLRPDDIDYVDWSIFSTPGLARELQFSLYNPNDIQVAVFICVDGWDVESEGYIVYPHPMSGSFSDQERARMLAEKAEAESVEEDRRKTKRWKESELLVMAGPSGDSQQVSGKEIELEPLEQRVIKISPTVSPYFDPRRIRFHGHRIDDGKKVPFAIIDAFCGDRVMYGTSLDDLFSQRTVGRRSYVQETPLQLMDRLQSMIATLTLYGKDGLAMRTESQAPALEDIRGMLTTHLVSHSGWGDVSWWPIFSTGGLKRELGIVVYNPWPFRIRASVSMDGIAMAELLPEPKGDRTFTETGLPKGTVPTGPAGPAGPSGPSGMPGVVGANGPAGPAPDEVRTARPAVKDEPIICPG